MRVSLVINTYNRMHTLPNALRSLEYLRYPHLEVIVVDGPSSDGTLGYIQSNWQNKIKIATCAEANLSKSRNVGIKHASGDIVCFTDDDGVPEPDWLDKLVTAYSDPQVAAAGGWVRNHSGIDYQTKYIISSRDATSKILIDDPCLVPPSQAHSREFPGLIGVNSSFRREVLVEIGGFDEEYSYFLDETDVLARIVDAGYKIAMVPDAEVHHKYAPSHIRSESKIAKSWLQIMTSTAYYIIRNARPQENLSWCMDQIGWHKENLVRHTKYFLSQSLIDERRYCELILDIYNGAERGIYDAFARPNRRLISHFSSPEWLAFPRLLAPEKRLRLAFVTGLYPPRPCGGVAVFIHSLAQHLASQGHEITVITQAEVNGRHTVDFENGIWVHRIPNDDTLAPEIPSEMPEMPTEQKNTAGRVLAELNRVNSIRQFHYVLGTIWDLDLAAIIASGKYATAMYLVTSYKLMEDSKPEWRTNSDFYDNHVSKMIAAESWALRNVNRVIASTHAILKDTEKAYEIEIDRNKLTILPFGVPSSVINQPKNRIASETVELLFVGRFEQRKGIDLILELLPEIMTAYKSLHFTLIGDSSIPSDNGTTYLSSFLDMYGKTDWINRVRFLGHVDNTTLEMAYASCDIFIAPSRYESFGLIYLEAMRFGKPCIGTTAGGIPEVVADNITGILTAPGDISSLRSAIQKLVLDVELRKEMGKAGRTRYIEKFTTEQFSSNIRDLIQGWMS